MTSVDSLFDQFAAAHARGQRPDVGAYLERAGRDAGRLGRLIDAFLQTVPARPAAPTETALLEARLRGEPALAVQRRRLGLAPADVARALREALGLAGGEERLERRYEELEAGRLDPGRVAQRLWEALDAVLGASARLLAGAVPAPAAPAFGGTAGLPRSAALRSRKLSPDLGAAAAPAPRPVPQPAQAAERTAGPPADDEVVDRLFGLL